MRRKALKKEIFFEEPNVNLTPLIDVVFVLLIGFIIIAPFFQIDRVNLAKGSSLKPLKEKTGGLEKMIYVKKDNSLFWGEKAVTLEELFLLLLEFKKKFPEATIQLVQDEKAFFGTYQSVKNKVEEAGFLQMDVLLQP